MDLTGVGATDDPTIQIACNQARTVINFQDTTQSGFYLAPNPGSGTSHQFKFPTMAAYQAFHDSVDVWVQAEKVAP
jgi:hypothetical protein